MTDNKANSSGAPFIHGDRIFGLYLIKYCGPDVMAAGISIMGLHCIRHGQTVKVLVMREAPRASVCSWLNQLKQVHLCGPTCPVYIYLKLVLHNLNLFPPCILLLHINTGGLDPCQYSDWAGGTHGAWIYRFLVTVCLIDLSSLSLSVSVIRLTRSLLCLWTSASFSANSSCNKTLYFMWFSVTSMSVLVLWTQCQSAVFFSTFCIK